MDVSTTYYPALEQVQQAVLELKSVIHKTPLSRNERFSKAFDCNVLLKREDLQPVRSYKLRGAYHKIASIPLDERDRGIVCASAGNHAQGVAFSCKKLQVHGTIFMPQTTPAQKIEQVRMFGEGYVEIKLEGDSFDDSHQLALAECERSGRTFVHPFDDPKVIEGQATVAMEILEQAEQPLDYLFVPIGGGGLAAGMSAVFGRLSPHTIIIGVEPEGAPAMKRSIAQGENTTLDTIETFVDGAAVRRVGDLNF